jgi:hypothetical protein
MTNLNLILGEAFMVVDTDKVLKVHQKFTKSSPNELRWHLVCPGTSKVRFFDG